MPSRIFKTIFLYLLLATVVFGQQKIVIMDLKSFGGIVETDIQQLSERFRSRLAQTNKFQVMERKDLESVDQEIALQTTDGFDQETDEDLEKKLMEALANPQSVAESTKQDEKVAVAIGQRQGAELVVLGYVGFKEGVYSIDIRMINCTTGAYAKSISESYKGSWSGLMNLMGKLGDRMAGKKSKLWMYLTGGGIVTVGTVAYLLLQPEEPGLPEPPSPPE